MVGEFPIDAAITATVFDLSEERQRALFVRGSNQAHDFSPSGFRSSIRR